MLASPSYCLPSYFRVPVTKIVVESYHTWAVPTTVRIPRLEPDCTTLRELDVNHITIIGTVLGQVGRTRRVRKPA